MELDILLTDLDVGRPFLFWARQLTLIRAHFLSLVGMELTEELYSSSRLCKFHMISSSFSSRYMAVAVHLYVCLFPTSVSSSYLAVLFIRLSLPAIWLFYLYVSSLTVGRTIVRRERTCSFNSCVLGQSNLSTLMM